MFEKKSVLGSLSLIGICLFGFALFANFVLELPKVMAGLCLGVGTVLMGVGFPRLLKIYLEKKEPEIMRMNGIEFHDERATMIRNRAKASAGGIIQWVIAGVIYLSIIMEAPTWVIFALTGIYMLQSILETVFNIKYQREF